jgi:hypothetical protein
VFVDRDDNVLLIYRGSEQYRRKGPLIIAAASAASEWTDWRIVYEEAGPFVNEMLGDPYRFRQTGILSIPVQDAPAAEHQPTELRVLDFEIIRDS